MEFQSKKCPNCGAGVVSTAGKCGQCGQQYESREVAPKSGTTEFNLAAGAKHAWLLLENGKPDKALEVALEVLSQDENNTEAYFVTADILATQAYWRYPKIEYCCRLYAALLGDDKFVTIDKVSQWGIRDDSYAWQSAERSFARALEYGRKALPLNPGLTGKATLWYCSRLVYLSADIVGHYWFWSREQRSGKFCENESYCPKFCEWHLEHLATLSKIYGCDTKEAEEAIRGLAKYYSILL